MTDFLAVLPLPRPLILAGSLVRCVKGLGSWECRRQGRNGVCVGLVHPGGTTRLLHGSSHTTTLGPGFAKPVGRAAAATMVSSITAGSTIWAAGRLYSSNVHAKVSARWTLGPALAATRFRR